jgi:ligand-binding sensor domain-containing protein
MMIVGNTVFPFNASSGFPSGSVNDLDIAPDQSIWFGYATGLVHYRDKKWNAYSAKLPAGIPFLSVDHVELGPDRRVWIASATEGVCPFDPVTLLCSTIYPTRRGYPITDLVVDADGVAYAATDGGGLLVLSADRVQTLAIDSKRLLSNEVLDIAEGPDGRMWIATDRGINIVDPIQQGVPWEVLDAQNTPLAFQRIKRMLPVPQGMWFLAEQDSLATFYDGQSWLPLSAMKGMTGRLLDAAVDYRGYIWFATDDGLKVWDGVLMRTYAPPGNLSGNVYQALYSDADGMWVGTDRGLLRYQRYRWSLALPEISVHAIAAGPEGGLLLGTDQGLVRYDGSQSYLWLINLGEEVVRQPAVTSIAHDFRGRLWVGTNGHGLFRYYNRHWEQFDTATGLPTNIIRALAVDSYGEIWIAAVTGEGGGALVRYMP